MTVLVTGGAGFIGANFISRHLKRSNDRLVCIDNLTYAGHLSTIKAALAHPSFTFIKGDICDEALVYGLFEKERPDIVVNFAAQTHVDRSIADPGIFVKTNTLGTQVLMDACRKYGAARFHHVSTDEVYGDLPLKSAVRFTEDSPLRPSSPYAASKAAADLLVCAYHRTYNLPVTLSRCANNYGAYQFPEKLIPLMIIKASRGLPLPVYAQGQHVRDWLHVEDHCAAIELIIRSGKIGEIYNIGTDNERANLEVVKMVLKMLGKPESLIRFVSDRPGHDLRYALDSSKINELGFAPQTPFEEGLRKTIAWYIDHQDWWQPLIG